MGRFWFLLLNCASNRNSGSETVWTLSQCKQEDNLWDSVEKIPLLHNCMIFESFLFI